MVKTLIFDILKETQEETFLDLPAEKPRHYRNSDKLKIALRIFAAIAPIIAAVFYIYSALDLNVNYRVVPAVIEQTSNDEINVSVEK